MNTQNNNIRNNTNSLELSSTAFKTMLDNTYDNYTTARDYLLLNLKNNSTLVHFILDDIIEKGYLMDNALLVKYVVDILPKYKNLLINMNKDFEIIIFKKLSEKLGFEIKDTEDYLRILEEEKKKEVEDNKKYLLGKKRQRSSSPLNYESDGEINADLNEDELLMVVKRKLNHYSRNNLPLHFQLGFESDNNLDTFILKNYPNNDFKKLFKSFKKGEAMPKIEDEEAICGICTSPFSSPEEKVKCIRCIFISCYSCLKQWERNNNTCPHCKTPNISQTIRAHYDNFPQININQINNPNDSNENNNTDYSLRSFTYSNSELINDLNSFNILDNERRELIRKILEIIKSCAGSALSLSFRSYSLERWLDKSLLEQNIRRRLNYLKTQSFNPRLGSNHDERLARLELLISLIPQMSLKLLRMFLICYDNKRIYLVDYERII